MPTTQNSALASIISQYNLDISIVDVKEIEGFSRIDSEFYGKEIMDNERKIKEGKFEYFGNIGVSKGGCAYSSEEFGEGNIRIAKITDVSQENSFENWETISDSEFNKFSSNPLQDGDILMSGTHHNPWDLGKVIYIKNIPNDRVYTWNQRVFRLRGKEDILKSECLYCLLQSKAIRLQIERYGRGNNQLNLNNEGIEALKIPLPSSSFQSSIASLVQTAHTEREKSKSLYAEAEQILLSELGLADWKPTEANIDIKTSEDVRLFGRCDAEFFQPKYDEVITKIQAYRNGFDTLENLIEVATKQIRPIDENIYQYCELADIDASLGLVSEFSEIQGKDLPSRARMKIREGDVLVSSVAGSSNKVALIKSNDDNLIASTGFFILRPKAFSSEVNLVLMKSAFIQEFMKRTARGMILSATNQDDFKKLLIPNIDTDTQKKISSLVISSHEARRLSKELLERAKRAVEMFIEEDEEKARVFLG